MARPRILFLCQTLPYPADGGVTIRTLNVLRQLSVEYDIHLLAFYRKRLVRDLAASLAGLRGVVTEVEAFPIVQEYSRTRFARDHVLSMVTRKPYTVFTYEHAEFRRRVIELVQTGGFSLAHVDSLDLSGYLPLLESLPIVCVHHNVESQLLRRRAAVESRWLRARYLHLQSRLMQREEEKWADRVTCNVVCSEDDGRSLGRISGCRNWVVVPNGVDVEEFKPAESRGHGIVFVGGLSWFPNRDALEHYLADVLPSLRHRGVSESTVWVGRATEEERRAFSREGVTLTGYVDDVRPYMAQAACFIVPLRVGGGTRLKILAAWAAGMPVVSTSIGCEGLDARDGWNILVRDDPSLFALAVAQVLADAKLRETLSKNARKTAEDTYSWEAIGASMRPVYARCLESRRL